MKELGVVVFDVNDLKSVNDNLGHDTGDIYIYTASMMISEFFENSPVYRIGGDEFAVILEGGDYGNREKPLAAFDHQSEESNARARLLSPRVWLFSKRKATARSETYLSAPTGRCICARAS